MWRVVRSLEASLTRATMIAEDVAMWWWWRGVFVGMLLGRVVGRMLAERPRTW